jgi:hypothetical protein
MPKDEPMGANPPPGAYIDYALDRAASGAVTLTISDARGVRVRSFSSNDQAPPPDLAKIDIAPEWIVPPEPLASTAGTHRFVWDLHYAPQAGLAPEDPSEEESGLWAPPGQYRIELDVDGKSYRQPLTVAADPRLKLAAIAYARQFALAREVEAARVQIARTLEEAKRIHAAILERSKSGSNPAAATLAAADQRLLAISDIAPDKQSPDASGPAPATIRGLRYLEAAFRNLARAVDGADALPTPDALRGYARHRALLNDVLMQWAQFTAIDVARLNAQLQSSGAAPIEPGAK